MGNSIHHLDIARYSRHKYSSTSPLRVIPTFNGDSVLRNRHIVMEVVDNEKGTKSMLELDEIFSEGNKYLKKLLNNLWDNDIVTLGCCTGHVVNIPKRFYLNERTEYTRAYITFLIRNKELYDKVFYEISSKKDFYNVSFSNNEISCRTDMENADLMFLSIDKALEEICRDNISDREILIRTKRRMRNGGV